MELIYQRNIRPYVIVLTIMSFSLMLSVMYLLSKGIWDYAVFVSLLFVPTPFLTFTSINVHYKEVEFIKYSVFGLIKKRFHLSTKNILSIGTFQEGFNPVVSDPEDATGMEGYSMKNSTTEFKYIDEQGQEHILLVKLTEKEYNLIQITLSE